MKTYPVSTLRGVTPAEVASLKALGIDTTAKLLAATPTRTDERRLASQTGISAAQVREAVNRADLMQVNGLGPVNSDLYENAGVNSAKELAQRNPASLAVTLRSYVKAHPELGYRTPGANTVATAVARAKELVAPPATPDPRPVASWAEAKAVARTALRSYIDSVLFSDHPDGASFRSELLGHRPSHEWAMVQGQMHTDVDLFLNQELAGRPQRAGYEGQEELADKFLIYGRLYGLYTEVHVDKPSGKPSFVYVEVD